MSLTCSPTSRSRPPFRTGASSSPSTDRSRRSPRVAGIQTSGPGAIRVAQGSVTINADRTAAERGTLVIVNTGDRPVQIGSHLHLPDANAALEFDREAARGFRLDIPSGTSRRFEPGASREVAIVGLRGRRVVPGLQIRGREDAADG